MKREAPNCCKKNTPHEKDLGNLKYFLSVINDKNRLRIICMLQGGEHCVCDIYEYLELPQNLVSYHLKILEGGGIVSWDKKGLNVFYKLNRKKLYKFMKLLNNFIEEKYEN